MWVTTGGGEKDVEFAINTVITTSEQNRTKDYVFLLGYTRTGVEEYALARRDSNKKGPFHQVTITVFTRSWDSRKPPGRAR